MILEYLHLNKNKPRYSSDDLDEQMEEIVFKYNSEDLSMQIINLKDSDYVLLRFILDGENKQNALTLSLVNEDITINPGFTTLTNEAAFYYNKELYPLVNKFERKLRKLLYLATTLSKNSSDFDLINNLEDMDFGTLFEILFTDEEFINNAKKDVNKKTWQYSKNEIIDALSNIPENTLWDKLPNSKIAQTLEENFILIKTYRNDVMHARNMDTKQFNDINNIFIIVNEELDDTINDILDNRLEESYMDNIQDFSNLLNEAIKSMTTITLPPNQLISEMAANLLSPLYPTHQELIKILNQLSKTLNSFGAEHV